MNPACVMSTLSNDEFCSQSENHSQLVAAPTHTGLVVTSSRTGKIYSRRNRRRRSIVPNHDHTSKQKCSSGPT